MRVNWSRLVNTPESTIASYWSTVNRASRFGTHLEGGRGGCLVMVDIGVSPSMLWCSRPLYFPELRGALANLIGPWFPCVRTVHGVTSLYQKLTGKTGLRNASRPVSPVSFVRGQALFS